MEIAGGKHTTGGDRLDCRYIGGGAKDAIDLVKTITRCLDFVGKYRYSYRPETVDLNSKLNIDRNYFRYKSSYGNVSMNV